MSSHFKDCEEAALRLSAEERAALATRLIESLDQLGQGEIEALWVREAERRYLAYKADGAGARLASDVLRDARKGLR